MWLILTLTITLLSTCFIEMVPHFFLKKRLLWIKTGLLCNVATNPFVNILLILMSIIFKNHELIIVTTILLELIVVFVEMMLYNLILNERLSKCLLVSAMCNLLSFTIGLLFDAFI